MANVVEVIFRGVDQISRNTSQINRSLGNMQRFAAQAGSALLAAFSVRELAQAADTMTLIENRLRLVTDSTAELVRVQSELLEIADQTNNRFRPTVELYTRIARSAETLGFSQRELLDLTQGINQAVLISGATAQEASAGLIQFAQGLASGALRGDELRSVLEQMPRLAQAIADGMGVTIGELRELGTEGELSAERVARAIQSQLGTLQEEAEQTSSTVGQALGNLGDAFVALIGRIDDALGASESVADFIGFITDFVQDLATTDLSELESDLTGIREEMAQLEEIAAQAVPAARAAAARFRLEVLRQQEAELEAQIAALQTDLSAAPEGTNRGIQELNDGLQEIVITARKIPELLPFPEFEPTGITEPAEEAFEQVSTFAEQAARNAQSVLADFLFDPFREGLDGMLAGFIDVIRRMVAEAAAAKLLENLFGKSEEGGGGGLAGFFQGLFGGLFGKGKAHGGFTTPGLVHPVNEREPEFLLTRGRSEVVPLSKAAAAGVKGGGSVFAPQTTFQLMTSPLSPEALEQFTQTREDMMFARFKQMLRDDGID